MYYDTHRRACNILYYGGDYLSDEDMKEIYQHTDLQDLAAMLRKRGGMNKRIFQVLHKAAGGEDFGNDVDDDTLQKYAENIKNYKYTYKDEAKQLDPGIDTETVHNGPMAQDIAKVNPAAVIKDESGYLKVDTGRLALMNAGVIADLARRMQELEAHVG